MSTKIYNGFKMKNLNTKQMNTFVRELYDMIFETFEKQYNNDFIRRVCSILDDITLLDKECKYESISTLLNQYHIMAFSSKAIRKLIFTHNEKINDLYAPNLLERYKYTSLKTLITDIKEQKLIQGMFMPTITDDHVHASIVVFPYTRRYSLFMTFSEELTQLMYKICDDVKYKKFRKKYKITEYHYQNSTDKPDDISNHAWQKREKDWDKVCPDAPNDTGTVIDILDNEKFIHKMWFHELYLDPEIINVKQRAAKKATDIVLDTYCKDENIKSDITTIMSTARTLRELKKDPLNKYAILQEKETLRLCDELKPITENIISTDIFNLIPNWYEHMLSLSNEQKTTESENTNDSDKNNTNDQSDELFD